MPPTDTGLWAVVEIMGHRTRAGLISDTQIGGATLLRIEHPTRTDHTGQEPLCEYYAATALFAIRPCSREEAEKTAAWCWTAIGEQRALGAGFNDLIDDDQDDEDDVDWVDHNDTGEPF